MTAGYAVVPCSDPGATICEPSPGPDDCAAQGYTMWMGADGDPWYCANPTCTYHPPTASVPELEGYAAALFLVLALTIGWRVRQRLRPAA